MNVALIAPKDMLFWTSLGDMAFIVPSNVRLDFDFGNMYKMLDNGTYESGKPQNTDEFVTLANKLQVDEIVLPDFIQRKDQTLMSAEEFITTVRKQWRYAGVPQGNDPLQWIECYEIMAENPDIDVLCIPIWLQKKFGCRPAVVHKLLKDNKWCFSKEHHLIGLDGYGELMCFPKSLIRSVDTSLPFSRANANLEITFEDSKVSRISLDKPKFEIDGNYLLNRNITKLLEIAHHYA